MIIIEFPSTIIDYQHILITYNDANDVNDANDANDINDNKTFSYMYVDFDTLCLLLRHFGYVLTHNSTHHTLNTTYIPFDYYGAKIYVPLNTKSQKLLK
jgi:hypothetical protein